MSEAKPTLNPYLNFDGKTAEVMRFYHSIIGGELSMQTFGESNMAASTEEKDRIVHAALKTDSFSIMASDTHQGQPVKFGDNVHLSLTGQEKDKLTEIFNGLSKGGIVDMPLAKQFWGDIFGMVTDKYGIHWMINITSRTSS